LAKSYQKEGEFTMPTPNTQIALQRAHVDYPRTSQEETLEMAAPVRESIEARAYELWQEEGQPSGAADRNWLQAESELKANGLDLP
jgi:hypothetical protein